MKYLFMLLATTAAARLYSQQYMQYETTITCAQSQKTMVADAREKIKTTLQLMVKDGKLVNFGSGQQDEKEKILLTYAFPSENEQKHKELNAEFKNRLSQTYPEVSKNLWRECPNPRDTIVNPTKMMYPEVKHRWTGVVVVEGIDELPDPNMDYNIVFDFTAIPTVGENKFKMDSTEVNWGLTDIGRIYNLHLAAGIPKNKIHMVAAVHAFASRSFLKNDEYRKRFKIDNPNLAIIEELDKIGVKFLLCGQSLNWMGDKKEMLLPQAKVSLTAQTTLTSYQLKGYALKSMRND